VPSKHTYKPACVCDTYLQELKCSGAAVWVLAATHATLVSLTSDSGLLNICRRTLACTHKTCASCRHGACDCTVRNMACQGAALNNEHNVP